MTLTIKLQNLQQKNGISFMIKMMWIMETKMSMVQALGFRKKL